MMSTAQLVEKFTLDKKRVALRIKPSLLENEMFMHPERSYKQANSQVAIAMQHQQDEMFVHPEWSHKHFNSQAAIEIRQKKQQMMANQHQTILLAIAEDSDEDNAPTVTPSPRADSR